MNYISSSRKILDSELYAKCCELIEGRNEQNEGTHDIVLVNSIHLLGCCLNDLPAQIPNIINTGVPEKLINSIDKRVPKNVYL